MLCPTQPWPYLNVADPPNLSKP